MRKIKLIIGTSVIYLICLACSSRHCNLDYPVFTSRHVAPLIFIDGIKEECLYSINGDFWLNDKHINSKGELVFKEQAFFIRVDSIGPSFFKYFDFSKKPGDTYQIQMTNGEDHLVSNTEAKLEKIVLSNKREVFMFRMKNSFSYEDHYYDVVFFVTMENGIIGSYISEDTRGIEIVMAPRGEILTKELDYSKREFRKLL